MFFEIDRANTPDVAIEDTEIIVVTKLHHLVPDAERTLSARELITTWVQERLQLTIQVRHAEAALVHRSEHLDVVDRVDVKARWNTLRNEIFDRRQRVVGLIAFDQK